MVEADTKELNIQDIEQERVLELALHSIFIYKPAFARAIRSEYQNLCDFFALSAQALGTLGGINESQISKITSKDYIDACRDEYNWCMSKGIHILRFCDFPKQLKEIPDAPFLLFCIGNVKLLECAFSVSVVGTRLATNYGKSVCDSIVESLSGVNRQIVIYSGLAYGTDANAHSAAIKYGLPTAAILPNGMDMIYPSVHRDLAKNIIKSGGLLISEFCRGTKPVKINFIKRNRIIAAISECVIVVESRIKGGAMLTAEYASDYGREVFAVPGRITDANSYGCNYLVSKNIAQILNTPAKVADILGWKVEEHVEVDNQLNLFETDSSLKFKILSLLSDRKPVPAEFLYESVDAPVEEISVALVELEIEGEVASGRDGFLLK